MKVRIPCIGCNSTFEAYESSTRTFCTRTCYRNYCLTEEGKIYKSNKILETKTKKGTRALITQKCKNCNLEYEKLKSDIKNFCSRECKYEHLSKNKEQAVKKMQQTSLEKYGTLYPNQNSGIKAVLKQTAETKYGTDPRYHPRFSEQANLKRIETNLQKYGRPYACSNFKASKPEKEIVEYIKEIHPNLEIQESNRTILGGRELDIFIPSLNIAIEYNGLYYHSEKYITDKHYHLNKTKDCAKQGITLYHIFADEWDNHQTAVKHRLKYLVKSPQSETVYARKTAVRELTFEETSKFLNTYHVQGNGPSSIKLGLEHEGELVAVMTFSQRRPAMGGKPTPGYYELARFATSKNVPGGASKLLKAFIARHTPKHVISYADRRWSQGNLYTTLGFKLTKTNIPSYWYTLDFKERLYRYNFRKQVLVDNGADPTLSESQIMQELGYTRIWDCGTLRFELYL
jgi:hypothetical protein